MKFIFRVESLGKTEKIHRTKYPTNVNKPVYYSFMISTISSI